jgi:glycine/D-amino acid oxidase-like deaminating enzyme
MSPIIEIDRESPFWSRTAPAAVEAAILTGEIEADVAVIGAGFLGLSTALHLAEAGARVAILEAQEPGAAASGRNTGFVIPNFPSPKGPDAAIEAFGTEAGPWLAGHVGRAATFTFDLMSRLGIEGEQERLGWAQAAHSPEVLDTLVSIASGWQRHGFPVELLGQDETAALFGFKSYPGCMVFRTGGQLNPLSYARGLARAAVAAGAALHARSPVLAIERSGPAWIARTPSGSLRAAEVVVTVNAATPGLMAGAGPLRISHMRQVATAPLAREASYRGPSLPFSDTAPHPNFALRTTRDGRLVTGGETGLARRRLAAIMPGQPIDIAYEWGGDTAHTETLMPRFRQREPGLFEAIGCNGRGVACTSMFGALIASFLTRQDGEAKLLARLDG